MRFTPAPAVAFALCASLVSAQTPAPAPKPAPEVDALRFFLGKWLCQGKAPASDLGPERLTRATVTFAAVLGGASYRFEYAEEKTKENPTPSSGLGFWGWDGAEKRFFGPSADNFGGVYLQTSKGWEGDKMVWEGSGAIMGKKVDARDTFLRIGPADVTHTYELKMDGKWVTLALKQCKRAPAVPRR